MTPTPTQAPAHDPAKERIEAQNVSSDNVDAAQETDNGPPRGAGDHLRKCIATGDRGARAQMLRFVLGPDHVVVPDIAARLPGRGAWTLSTREAVDLAVAKKAFNRAFKRQVETPESLTETVEILLLRKCLDLLGFAKRSGELILGFDQVREEIKSARPACLIEAADGAEDGRRKVLSLAKGLHGSERRPAGASVIGCFTAAELGMALGRDRVIHAVVKQGRFAETWSAETARLGGFRTLVPNEWTTT